MFARNVSIRLKPGKLNEFTRTFDEEVLSILRKQPGFREEITFASPGEMELIAISLWDTKEQADAYQKDTFPQVSKILEPLLTKTLPGFGELFRMLSYEEIGAAAMLSRAIGGLIGRTVVLAMPGSTAAVRLAMEKLVIPEIAHLVREARR